MPSREFPFNQPIHPEDNQSINRVFDRNYGNKLKSGDTTTLKYTVKDGDGEPLDKDRLIDMTTKVILKYDGIIAYETAFDAIIENETDNYAGDLIARFKVEEVLPPDEKPYVIEFHFEELDQSDEVVDRFIFPSGNTLELFITPSALNSDDKAIEKSSEQRLKEIVESSQTLMDVKTQEEERIANEEARQAKYIELVDTGIMQENINQKLSESEQTYAPRLTNLEQNDATLTAQLAQKAKQITDTKEIEALNNVLPAEPIHIKTFDGTDQPIHPSVYYNENGWNGAKFWMAYSPWPNGVPPYMDRWECPCIVKSNNGIDWDLPFGAPDPLVDLTPEEILNKDYLSDPAIVMNGDTMEVWYRKTRGDNTSITNIFRVSSQDGVTWSEPEIVLDVQRTDNGFSNMETMRSHQVFYDGAKYTSFFGMQGGGGFWKADSITPSTGVWGNITRLTFNNRPNGMDLWHIGMGKEDDTYHLTGYDSANNAIQYFISTDGTNFDFAGTILKSDSNTETFTYYSLYQSVPVKVKNEWLLYASGDFRRTGSSKKGIALYSGKNLDNLTSVPGRMKLGRQYFDETTFLNNAFGNNSSAQRYYGTFADPKLNRYSGYRMNFGNNNNAPAWFDSSRARPIVHVFDDTSPKITLTPEHVGVINRNINTKEMRLSVGTESPSDWKNIKLENSPNSGNVVNNQRKDVSASSSIDVTDVYRLVINEGLATTITNLTGVIDGQELWVLNTRNHQMTFQNGASGSGNMRFKDGVDVVLKQWEAISLISVGSTWYQK